MKITDVFKILDNYAPLDYSAEFCKKYGAYDNSGIIVNNSSDITGVVFSLDLTVNAINEAEKRGCNLIVTHHPAIYKPINAISESDALYLAINKGIGVISMHLNLDSCNLGTDYYLAKGLGAINEEILMPVFSYGYGRKFEVNKTLNEIVSNYKTEFKSDKVFVYGNLDKKIKTVASFCGAGFGDEEFNLSKTVDLIVSADIPHHMILKAVESGKCVMQITHYASEIYGFKKFYESINIENKTLVIEDIYK